MTTIVISTTEIAVIAGSMLSRNPIHISRGRVTALIEVMKKGHADLYPSQDEGQEERGEKREADIGQDHPEHPRRDARAHRARGKVIRRSSCASATETSTTAKGAIITAWASATPAPGVVGDNAVHPESVMRKK